ncbi:MAG: hypothetical protein ABUL46_03870, partial [Chitinophaga rupis]
GQVVAKENFVLKDTHGPASLEVITRYSGSFADEVRNEINSNAKSDLQQTYLNFYNSFYEGAKVSDSLKIEEDEKDGTVTTYEYYTIHKMWETEKGVNKAAFDALLISSLVKKPKEHDRTMPIALTYPAHYTEEIRISVPEDWHFEQTPSELKSPGFLFHSSVDASDRTVNLKYEYRALKDHITTEEAATWLSDYDKLKDDLGYELTEGSPVTPSPNSSSPNFGNNNALKALLCFALLAGITYMARRKR